MSTHPAHAEPGTPEAEDKGHNDQTVPQAAPDFGDYVTVEQRRFGVPNEHYLHKVIGRLRSNTWIDVPAQTHLGAVLHDHEEEILRVICCGVFEEKVMRYRVADCKPVAGSRHG